MVGLEPARVVSQISGTNSKTLLLFLLFRHVSDFFHFFQKFIDIYRGWWVLSSGKNSKNCYFSSFFFLFLAKIWQNNVFLQNFKNSLVFTGNGGFGAGQGFYPRFDNTGCWRPSQSRSFKFHKKLITISLLYNLLGGARPSLQNLSWNNLSLSTRNSNTAKSNLTFEAPTQDHPGHQFKHNPGKLKITQSPNLSTTLANLSFETVT